MLSIRSIAITAVGLSLSFLSFLSFAQETVTTTTVSKNVVITPPPKSINCTTINAHWQDNIWVDTQTICKYESRAEGVAWVNDFWACTVTTADGQCTTWELRPGYWI